MTISSAEKPGRLSTSTRSLARSSTRAPARAPTRAPTQRRETWSTSATWSSNAWSKATESLHGEHGYEIYSMVPFRGPDWPPGLCKDIHPRFTLTPPANRPLTVSVPTPHRHRSAKFAPPIFNRGPRARYSAQDIDR